MGDKAPEGKSPAGRKKSRRPRKNTKKPRHLAARKVAATQAIDPGVAGVIHGEGPDPAPVRTPTSPLGSDPPAAPPGPEAPLARPGSGDLAGIAANGAEEASSSGPHATPAPEQRATPPKEDSADAARVDPAAGPFCEQSSRPNAWPAALVAGHGRAPGSETAHAGRSSHPTRAERGVWEGAGPPPPTALEESSGPTRVDSVPPRTVPPSAIAVHDDSAPRNPEVPSGGPARPLATANAAMPTTPSPPVAPPRDRLPAKPAERAAPPMAAVDLERFSQNIVRLIEEGGKAFAAYLKPREEGQVKGEAQELVAVVKTLGQVVEYWLGEPQRALELQARLGTSYLDLWAAAVRRMVGEKTEPVAKPDPKDTRFADPEWSSNQFFDFVKQAYLLTTNWADRLVKDARGLDPHTRQKAEFYVRQIANAISPSNFVLTNPELIRETFASNAENLVRGMQMLTEDIGAGHGHLKIRQSDSSMFEVGRNLAITPGRVIYQNDLMQLIQYSPTTKMVLKRPLLIVPPWINKYYILDLRPDKSFIKWCVDQGLTVFVISWVNPDARLAKKSFEEYMRQGPFEALDVINTITGEDEVHAIGYCVGGTLLAVTLAYLAAKDQDRFLSATLFTAQVDFTYAGDLLVFVDEEQVCALERQMEERGFLEGEKMAAAFNLLRSNDLIWPYVINNYLKGKAPFPFDLLYWNSDATRMPAANHSFYLRNCYLENKLTKGEMVVGGRTLELHKVKVPIYNLATREDHIAPAKSVFLGSKFFGGPLRYVLAGSGHIAGVINPPAAQKYGYWTGGPPEGTLDHWIQKAEQHSGSWWPDWLKWIKDQDPREVPARTPGGGKFSTIEDAPGSYVKVRD
jgi:polyhydroxyalkanoate synthase subunit PhaC